MNFRFYVVYWTKWEGFLFQSVPSTKAAVACEGLSGYHSTLVLEMPDEDTPEVQE
jgi:hypothetical protein